jgi:hypothetical protein
MKLEFLPDGASDCPLIRLYNFDQADAMRLREAFRCLSDGSRHNIALHEEWWIESVGECHLDLRAWERDLGVVERLPLKFECVLTPDAWSEMVEKSEVFCTSLTAYAGEAYQWLNNDGEVSLLLSPDGKW